MGHVTVLLFMRKCLGLAFDFAGGDMIALFDRRDVCLPSESEVIANQLISFKVRLFADKKKSHTK